MHLLPYFCYLHPPIESWESYRILQPVWFGCEQLWTEDIWLHYSSSDRYVSYVANCSNHEWRILLVTLQWHLLKLKGTVSLVCPTWTQVCMPIYIHTCIAVHMCHSKCGTAVECDSETGSVAAMSIHTYFVFSHMPSVAYAQRTQILHFLLFIIVLCMWLPSILMDVCVYSLYTRGVSVCSSLWWHLRSVVEHRPPAQEPAEDMLRRMPRPCKFISACASLCYTLPNGTLWHCVEEWVTCYWLLQKDIQPHHHPPAPPLFISLASKDLYVHSRQISEPVMWANKWNMTCRETWQALLLILYLDQGVNFFLYAFKENLRACLVSMEVKYVCTAGKVDKHCSSFDSFLESRRVRKLCY